MNLFLKSFSSHLTYLVIIAFAINTCYLNKSAKPSKEFVKISYSKSNQLFQNNNDEIFAHKDFKGLLIKDSTKTYDETIKDIHNITNSIDLQEISLDSLSNLFTDLLVK